MEKQCRDASERMGVDYIGNSTIIDLEGLSLSRHMNIKALTIFKEMILIHTYYYPESSDVVYVINYPPIFNYFWNGICSVVLGCSDQTTDDRAAKAEVETSSQRSEALGVLQGGGLTAGLWRPM